MNLKSSFLQHVNVWLSVLFAVVGAAISIRFITGLPNALWWQSIYVFVAASGVFFIGHFLLQTLLVSDASVNFHFDATRSFHLKIGKIK